MAVRGLLQEEEACLCLQARALLRRAAAPRSCTEKQRWRALREGGRGSRPEGNVVVISAISECGRADTVLLLGICEC